MFLIWWLLNRIDTFLRNINIVGLTEKACRISGRYHLNSLKFSFFH